MYYFQMEKELYRLATFYSWPDTSDFSPLQLAKNGFFFTGCGDEVECFACKVHLSQLSAKENLNERHKQCSPVCAFVCGNDTRNSPLKPPCLDGRSITTLETFADDNCDEAHDRQAIKNVCKLAIKRAISKNLFFTSTNSITDRSKLDYEKLRYEQVRLNTFYDWPSGAKADPCSLAQDGLFYTGSADRVQCAFCRGLMRNWEPADIPSAEHRRHYPDCPFVQGRDVGNVPLAEPTHTDSGLKTENITYSHLEVEGPNSTMELCQRATRQLSVSAHSVNPADPPLYPEYSDISKRIKSFLGGIVSPGQTAEGLADAGFFYVGPGDKVQCFHCAGNLTRWELEDDPWEQHKVWYGTCSYLRTHQPTPRRQIQEMPHQPRAALTQTYHVEPREVKARMDTPSVRAILNMGYSRELVKTAIENRLSTAGDDFPNAESLLEALFQLEEAASGPPNNLILLASRLPGTDVLTDAAVVSSATSAEHVQSSTNSGGISQPSFVPSLSVLDDATSVQSLSAPVDIQVAPVDIPVTELQSKTKKKKNRKKKPSAASNLTSNEEEHKNILVNSDQNDPVSTTPEANSRTGATIDEALQYAEQNRQLREARMCKVCMDAEVDTVFLPCGHLVCCNNCSPRMQNCPICRKRIQGTVKTFLS